MSDQEINTYFKVYRSILDWRWFKNPNTLQVFVWLLASANIKPNGFMGFDIQRGDVATSYATISRETGQTIDQARTSISHLKETGEIILKRHSKFIQVSIVNYDYYQGQWGKGIPIKSQSDPNQIPFNSHSLPNHSPITSQSNPNNQRMEKCNNGKKGKKKEEPAPLREWEKSIPERFRGRFETERDWKIFTGEEVGEDE